MLLKYNRGHEMKHVDNLKEELLQAFKPIKCVSLEPDKKKRVMISKDLC